MRATLQVATPKPAVTTASAVSFQPYAVGLLQRKCACGSSGQNEEREKRLDEKAMAPQFKLAVNQPGDRYEHEADAIANQVMRMPAPHIQRQAEPREEDEEKIQAKELPGSTPVVAPSAAASIQSMRGGGEPLAENSRAFFEARLGHDFGQVRIHRNSAAAATAHAVRARAFTIGSDIVFGTGEFAPETDRGGSLLAHELVHVVQQSHASEASAIQRKELAPTTVESPGTTEAGPTASEIAEAPITVLGAEGSAGTDGGLPPSNVVTAAQGSSIFSGNPAQFLAGGERLSTPLRSFFESRFKF